MVFFANFAITDYAGPLLPSPRRLRFHNHMKHLIFIFLTIALTALLPACRHEVEGIDPAPDRDYLSEVRSVNKLILARMTISKMATIDDIDIEKARGLKQTTMGLIDAVKLGDRIAAYSYSTYLQAYIDLSSLTASDIDVNDATKTITLTLPHIRTEFAGRDVEIREEHYRVTGLRSEINAEERAQIKEDMNTALKQEVEQRSVFSERLLTDARAKCDAFFKSLLGRDGYSVAITYR